MVQSRPDPMIAYGRYIWSDSPMIKTYDKDVRGFVDCQWFTGSLRSLILKVILFLSKHILFLSKKFCKIQHEYFHSDVLPKRH
jgi:hypothetical protein